MSCSAHNRLEAWERKFGKPQTGRSSRGKGGVVKSPIPREKLRLVSDSQWLSIVARDWATRQKSAWRRDFLIEVSHEQFARDIEVAARLNPERFISLALRIPPSAPRAYFTALLNAFGDKPPTPEEGAPANWRSAPVDRIEDLLRHIQDSLKERNIAWALCQLVRMRAAEHWSDWVLNLVRGFAESQPEPGDSPALETEEGEDIYIAVEESVRGAAAEALMELLFEKRELTDTFIPTVEKLVSDPKPVIRVAAQGLCIPLLNVDRDMAVRLFLKSCDHPDDRVLAGTHINRFLMYTWNRHPSDLAPLLERMVESDNEEAAKMGAFWATAGQIGEGFYGELAVRCLDGSEAHRQGAAKAMAQLLRRPESKQAALSGLLDLLHNSDEAAENEAADLLRQEEILESPDGPVLAGAYIRSSAMEDDPRDLFYGLGNFTGSLVPYASVLQEAVQRLGGNLAPATRDFSSKLSGAARLLPEILLRLYEQAEGQDLISVRNACLDAWDSLLRHQVGSNWDVLRRIDA